jgi:hypothetical protein
LTPSWTASPPAPRWRPRFATFWKTETTPEPRRELLAQLFDLVWIRGQPIGAVKPTAAFAGLFVPQSTGLSERFKFDGCDRPTI